MKKIIASMLFIVFGMSAAEAQKKRPRKSNLRWEHNFGAAVGLGEDDVAASLSWFHLYSIGSRRRFQLGYGLRLTGDLGDENDFTSAPHRLAKDEELTDTLFLESNLQFSLNLGIYSRWHLSEKWAVGLNLDLAGITFGTEEDQGVLQSTDLPAMQRNVLNNTPYMPNLWAWENHALGMINGELYAAYKFAPKWRVRAGVQRLFYEYQTEEKYLRDNDRYRSKAFLGFIGVTFTPFLNEVTCPKFKYRKPKQLKEGEF